MNFSGQFNVSIDPKGRISVPASFRDELREVYQSESIVVTTFDGGLVGYPPGRWQEICDKVKALPSGPLKEASLRARIAPAQECAFNKQGRIQVPQSLRDYAGLEKDAVVVGMFEKIEIWNKQAHMRISQDSEDILKEHAQGHADIGF